MDSFLRVSNSSEYCVLKFSLKMDRKRNQLIHSFLRKPSVVIPFLTAVSERNSPHFEYSWINYFNPQTRLDCRILKEISCFNWITLITPPTAELPLVAPDWCARLTKVRVLKFCLATCPDEITLNTG